MSVRFPSAAAAFTAAVLLALAAAPARAQDQALTCAAKSPVRLLPKDPKLCADLAAMIRAPAALPLAEYEARLGDFLCNFCHCNEDAGWRRDKWVRDTGPYIATLSGGQWLGKPFGTHVLVVIWYSKEMLG